MQIHRSNDGDDNNNNNDNSLFNVRLRRIRCILHPQTKC